jgi:hypothetical protein
MGPCQPQSTCHHCTPFPESLCFGQRWVLSFTAAVNDHADLGQDETESILETTLPVGLLRQGENSFIFQGRDKANLLDLWVDLNYPPM